jgi:hypothetical protein
MNTKKPQVSYVLPRLTLVSILLIFLAYLLVSDAQVSLLAGPTDQALDVTSFVTQTNLPAIPECHRLAMEYVSRQHDIPIDQLITGSYIWYEDGEWFSDWKEEWVEFPSIQKKVCTVKVYVKGSDKTYGVDVDEKGAIVNLEDIRALEAGAYRARCGKFDEALCERLPTLAEDELVEVAIWLTDIDVAAIYDEVAKSYAPGLQLDEGLPFDIGHPDFEQAFQEVERLMRQAYREKERLLLDLLERQGYKAEYASSSSPVVFATLPKSIIVAMVNREDVGSIYLLKGELHDRLNTVVPKTAHFIS